MTPTFKLLKELCLGRTPLFYLDNNLPKNLKKTTVGIRVPDNEIALAIVKLLGIQ
jgi:tRNA A37 threonylcarbamoyladenosine synthetase subunit TsaC/SUA5/YrdC